MVWIVGNKLGKLHCKLFLCKLWKFIMTYVCHIQLPISYKTVRLFILFSYVFIAMSCKQLHGWQKPVTNFNSLFPVRFLMSFFFTPWDLFKRQSNKHLYLLLLIKCVIKAEKFKVTFYLFSFLSGIELDTGKHVPLYIWKKYKRINQEFKNT